MAVAKALLSLVLLSLVACGPHRIPLPPPPEGASAKVRLQAFEEMRPRTEFKELWINDANVVVRTVEESLVLNSGLVVEHPLDLVPWVPRGTQVEHQAERFEARDATARAFEIPLFVTLALGLPASFLGFQQYFSNHHSEALIVGLLGVGGLATSVLMGLLAHGPRLDAKHAKLSAFLGYEAALKKKLDLCDEPGGRVVACESVRPPALLPAQPESEPLPWRRQAPPEPNSSASGQAPKELDLEPVDESDL